METIQAAVAEALSRAPGRVYVGFSGGRDSSVLLHAVTVQRREGVVAVHVDHGLHPDSAAWEAHCRSVAEAREVSFLARRVPVSRQGSLEARARAARYEVFAGLLKVPGDCLLLAHHRQDQSETVLLRLLQGRGLYGMPRQRPLAAGKLVRPLLDVPPDLLEAYARAHGLTWVEDPGNADERLDRNFLRRRVLPPLRLRWPDVDGALLDAMESHRLAQARLAAPFGALARASSLPCLELERRPATEAVELLRLWLEAHGIAPPARSALGELLRQVRHAAGDRQPLLALPDARLARHGGCLHLIRPEPALAPRYPVTAPGVTRLPHGELELREDPGGFRPVGGMEVRFRAGGERLQVGARHRSLKALFQEAGVPPWRRGSHPLVFDQAGLLAVPNVARRHEGGGGGAGPGGWRAEWRPHPV